MKYMKYYYAILFIIVFSGLLLVTNSTVHAQTIGGLQSQLPSSDTPEQYLDLSDGYETSSGYGADVSETNILVYSKTQTSQTVQFDIAADSPCPGWIDQGHGFDSHLGISFLYPKLTTGEELSGGDYATDPAVSSSNAAQYIAGCDGSGYNWQPNFTITIPASNFVASALPEHSGLYVADIFLQMIGSQDGTDSAFITVNSNDLNSSISLGSMADSWDTENNPRSSLYPLTAIFPESTTSPNPSYDGSKTYNLTWSFAPSCTGETTSDLDSNALSWVSDAWGSNAQQNPDMTIELLAQPRPVSSGVNNVTPHTYVLADDSSLTTSELNDYYNDDNNGDFNDIDNLKPPSSSSLYLYNIYRDKQYITAGQTTISPGTNTFSSGTIPDWSPDYEYQLVFTGVNDWNGIGVYLPFNSSEYGVQCPSAPSPIIRTATCTYLDITNDDSHRTFVSISGISGGNDGISTSIKSGTSSRTDMPTGWEIPDGGSLPSEAPDSSKPGLDFPNPYSGWFLPDAVSGKSVTYELTYRPDNPSITIRTDTQSLNSNGDWVSDVVGPGPPTTNNPYGTPQTYPCYSATCSVNVVPSTLPDGTTLPSGTDAATGLPYSGVIAGQSFDVEGQINDTSTGGLSLPNTIDGYSLSLTSSSPNDPDYYPGYPNDPGGYYDSGSSIALPQPTASGSVSSYKITYYPDYWGDSAMLGFGTSCSAIVNVYQPFNLSSNGSTELVPSPEDPTSLNYWTSVTNNNSNTISGTNLSYSCVYNAADATSCQSGTQIEDVSGGSYTNTTDNNGINCTLGSQYESTCSYSNSTNITQPIKAGDQYCWGVALQYTSGYVGPNGDIEDQNGGEYSQGQLVSGGSYAYNSNCSSIHNDPYFKVAGVGGVSAGGSFSAADSNCSGGGELASWNNDENGYDFGGGAELNALAFLKIIGFASDQTSGQSSPTGLSFANSAIPTYNYSSDPYNPTLGGEFGSSTNSCLSDETVPTDATSQSSSLPVDLSTLTGANSYNGDITINDADPIPEGDNVSVYVTGNVYISSNIEYASDNGSGANATWGATNDIPSVIVHVTGGNIYIDPNVTELDGIYTAEPPANDSSSSTGQIYDCATGIGSPVSAANMYATCYNQLVVYGSFDANQVNLMRTYGSLRDETPVTSASITKSGADYTSCVSIAAQSSQCDNIGGSVYNLREFAATYSLAGLPSSSDDNITINYQNYQGGWPLPSDLNPPYYYEVEVDINGNPLTILQLPTCDGQCTYSTSIGPINVASPSITFQWLNNGYPPSNSHSGYILYHGSDGPKEYDPNLEIDSFTVTTSYTEPSPLYCSTANGPELSTDSTCAAELFEVSPEIYLSSPAEEPPNGGATQIQAITSLPPVL